MYNNFLDIFSSSPSSSDIGHICNVQNCFGITFMHNAIFPPESFNTPDRNTFSSSVQTWNSEQVFEGTFWKICLRL